MNPEALRILDLCYDRSHGHYRKFMLEAQRLTNLSPRDFQRHGPVRAYVAIHHWTN